MTRVRRVAAVAVTLAAAVLATTAQNDAHAATTGDRAATAARAGSATTHLHLHVTGCDTCRITLQHAVTGAPHVWTSPEKTVGPDHRLSWTVPTGRTHGMSFVLRAPWAGNTGAVPNLVTRYRGSRVDAAVTRDRARHGRHAEGCWAGTEVDDVTLDFRVARIGGLTVTGQPTRIPLAYATHAMSSWKPMVKTYRGTIGNQDAFYCTKPARTKVTLTAPGCTGCEVGLMNGATRVENTWAAAPRPVVDGSASFLVPRPLTRGISATVRAPWEGNTGYTTVVAWRYAGHRVGDPVSFADARSQERGSPCWAGTSAAETTVALTVREVTVAGNTGPTSGTIAYADVTQPWLRPMEPAFDGVVGSQDVIACRT
jgi:hypothetical protein